MMKFYHSSLTNLLILVVFLIVPQGVLGDYNKIDIHEFAKRMQVNETVAKTAFDSLDRLSSIMHKDQKLGLDRKLGTCQDVAAFITHYRAPIKCELSPDDDSHPANNIIRYLQDEIIPFLEFLRSLGFSSLFDENACFPPAYSADLLVDLVLSVDNPCYALQKSTKFDMSRTGSILDMLYKAAARLSKTAVVGKYFKCLKVVLDPVRKFWRNNVQKPSDAKCNAMSKKTKEFRKKVEEFIEKYQRYMDYAINFLSYESIALCQLLKLNPETTSNRMLRVLKNQQNTSITTGEMKKHRSLAYNPALVDLTPLHEIEDIIPEIIQTMSDFGETLDFFVSNVEDAFSDVNELLDQSILPKIIPALGKVAHIADEISSKLKFLQCPSKGFFGFLCNLDSLIIDMVNKILRKLGIDIDAMIGDLVESILNPILKLPDLTELIPGFDFLEDILDVNDLLLSVQEKFDQIGSNLDGFNILEDSVSYTGVPDLVLDNIGPIEFLYAKGSLDNAAIECVDDGTFPYALSVIQRNKCAMNDITRFFDLPCGFDQSCDVDMTSFVSDLPFCPSEDLISDIGVESSNILYICIDEDQFLNFDGMPAQHMQYIYEEEYECPSDTHEKLYMGELRGRDDCSVAKLSLCLIPIRDLTDRDSDTKVALNAGVTYSGTFAFHENPIYEYQNCIYGGPWFQSFFPHGSIKNLVMECPSNHVIRVEEVLRESMWYTAGWDRSVIRQLYFGPERESTDGHYFTTDDAKNLCNDKNSCEFVAEDKNGYGSIMGMVITVHRARYKCLEYCPDGHNLLPTDDGRCIPCGKGFYRDDSMNACEPCAIGKFNMNETAATSCTSCPLGSYNSIEGNTMCTVCDPGYVTIEDGSSSADDCIPCKAGEFEMSGICDLCPAGTSSTIASFDCFNVTAGSFNNGTGVQVCSPGSFSSQEGALECTLCEQGTYTRDSNSTGCIPCSIGTYQNEKGQISCKACPDNLITFVFGAVAEDECKPKPVPKQYSSMEYNGLNCEEVLSIDLMSDGTLTEEVKDYVLQQRIMQVGDGICNSGPWNTEQCNFDGGDCCAQSCIIPDDNVDMNVETTVDEDGVTKYVVPDFSSIADVKHISDLSCEQSTFNCMDPKYANEPILPAVTACSPDEVHKLNDISCNFDLGSINQRKGDGICDPCLNHEEFEFDGGDCCAETCVKNPVFANSCLSFCSCKQDLLIDTTPPELFFEKDPDIEITVPVRMIPEPPLVFATDNVAYDFDPTVHFIETHMSSMVCSNTFTLHRRWLAIDAAGNKVAANSTIHVEDFDPPVVLDANNMGALTCFIADQKSFSPSEITVAFPSIEQALLELDDVKDDCGMSRLEYCDDRVTTILRNCTGITSQGKGHNICNIDGDMITLKLEYGKKISHKNRRILNKKMFLRHLQDCGGCDDNDSDDSDEDIIENDIDGDDSEDDDEEEEEDKKQHFDIIIGFRDECGNVSMEHLTRRVTVVWPSTDGKPPPGECNRVYFFDEFGKLLLHEEAF